MLLCRAASWRMGVMSAGAPAKWTGTIKRVRLVIFFAIVSAVTISVSRSTSANTGVAPANTIRLTVDTQVMEGVITSSPGADAQRFESDMHAGGSRSDTYRRPAARMLTKARFQLGIFESGGDPAERSTSATAAISVSRMTGGKMEGMYFA